MFGASQTFGANQGGDAGANSGKQQRKQDDKQACMPVTIRSIEDALIQKAESNGELQFFGKEPAMLILVACVEKVMKSGSVLEVSLNDGSGRIKARHYVTDNSKKHVDTVEAGRYLSVVGNVRTAPEVHFAIQMLKPVNSADEVSFHWIEVAHAALKLTKGVRTDPITPSRPVASKSLEKPGDWQITPPKEIMPKADEPMPQASVSAPAASMASGPLKGAALKSAIIEFIRVEMDGKPAGVSLQSICRKFDSVAKDEVKHILNESVDSGDVFNTIDDTHFQIL